MARRGSGKGRSPRSRSRVPARKTKRSKRPSSGAIVRLPHLTFTFRPKGTYIVRDLSWSIRDPPSAAESKSVDLDATIPEWKTRKIVSVFVGGDQWVDRRPIRVTAPFTVRRVLAAISARTQTWTAKQWAIDHVWIEEIRADGTLVTGS